MTRFSERYLRLGKHLHGLAMLTRMIWRLERAENPRSALFLPIGLGVVALLASMPPTPMIISIIIGLLPGYWVWVFAAGLSRHAQAAPFNALQPDTLASLTLVAALASGMPRALLPLLPCYLLSDHVHWPGFENLILVMGLSALFALTLWTALPGKSHARNRLAVLVGMTLLGLGSIVAGWPVGFIADTPAAALSAMLFAGLPLPTPPEPHFVALLLWFLLPILHFTLRSQLRHRP